MTIRWIEIIDGATAGVVASVLLGLFAIGRNRFRNLVLRWRIRRDLKHVSYGSGIHGVSATVRNWTGKVFTVRELYMLTPEMEYRLNSGGEVNSSFPGDSPKLTRTEKRRLKQGFRIEGRPRLQFGAWRVPAPASGFITIAPFTAHTFMLPLHFVADLKSIPTSLRIVLEYESWTHDIRIVQREIPAAKVLGLQIKKLKSELESGTLNKARRKFNLPEVRIPQTKPSASPDGIGNKDQSGERAEK